MARYTCFPPFNVGQFSHTSAAAFCPTAEVSTDGCRTETEATAGLLQMGSAESAQWGRQLVCRSGGAILAAPPRCSASCRLKNLVDAGRSMMPGRLWWCRPRLFFSGRCAAPNSSRFPSCLMSSFAVCSNLVCRPKSGWGRAARLETIRRGRANPTRKRVFGGAWPHSAPVRCRTRARQCLLARTDCVLFARAAGRYARCP